MEQLNVGSTHSESKKLVEYWANRFFIAHEKNKSLSKNIDSSLLDKPLNEIIKLAEKNKELLTACEGLLVAIKLNQSIDSHSAIAYAEEVLGITK